ncbi:hypothetical protein F4801DRAFT_580713 [Xylaria longipes]|nr:hypothetical protein F4801DRAFT_580713 [Xylaria longipes]
MRAKSRPSRYQTRRWFSNLPQDTNAATTIATDVNSPFPAPAVGVLAPTLDSDADLHNRRCSSWISALQRWFRAEDIAASQHLSSHRSTNQNSISGLVVKSIVAIDGPRVRFTADA